MKKIKYNKQEDFAIRENDNANGICDCLVNGVMFPHCLEIGICPSLKITAVFKGKLRKEKSSIRKPKTVLRKIK